MSRDLPDSTVNFLKIFFGPGNLIAWEDIISGALGKNAIDFLNPWFQRFSLKEPTVLPRQSSNNTTEWYAIAFSPFQFRILKEDLTAFVGPTYTTFSGRKAILEERDPIEAAIIAVCGREVIKFQVVFNSEENSLKSLKHNARKVRDAINLMHKNWSSRPKKSEFGLRSTGRILRDFDMALACGNENGAKACLGELRSQGRLSIQNMLFLRVRYLSSVSRWNDILTLENFSTLLEIRRPLLVTQELLRAIYRIEFQEYEINENTEGAKLHFKKDILPRYRSLFRARSAMQAPEVFKLFMLFAACNLEGPDQEETRNSILGEYSYSAPDRSYLEKLAELIPITSTKEDRSPINIANVAYESGNYDLAFKYLLLCEPQKTPLRMLLICAEELDTLDAIRSAINYMEKASSEEREIVLESRLYRGIWARLLEGATKADDFPKDWVAWIEKLDKEGPWRRARHDVERGCLEWDVLEYKNDVNCVERLSELIQKDRDDMATEELKNVLPNLIRFFLPEDQPEREFRYLYKDFLFLIAYESRLGMDELSVAQELAEAILGVGIDDTEYSDLLELLGDIWTTIDSPHYLDWALDILDLLISSPCSLPAKRELFMSSVLASLGKWSRRVEMEQWDWAEILFQDLGHLETINGLKPSIKDGVVEKREKIQIPKQLAMVLYTLNKNVGNRFKQIVSNRFPDLKLEICDDKVGNDRLRNLARESDIFVIVWRCAKHAATEAIKEARGGKPGLLYPQGKGCGSILRSFYGYIKEISDIDSFNTTKP